MPLGCERIGFGGVFDSDRRWNRIYRSLTNDLARAGPMTAYLRPTSIDAALRALASRPLVVLAGGTDFYPARVGRPLDEDVLDITAIASLRGIVDAGDQWRIGATTTWSDLVESDMPPLFDGLRRAARHVPPATSSSWAHAATS
jgi:xanthine dehydrogenase iron-sulfur cluster and FAD-binding subunit A